MGGTFQGVIPGMDPLFYMIHNFVNKVLANYQQQGPEHFTGGGRWNNSAPVGSMLMLTCVCICCVYVCVSICGCVCACV